MIAGDRFSVGILRKINTARTAGQRPCPFCSRQMLQFPVENPPLQLDACRACNLVWFDAQEFEAIPEKPVESVNEMHLRVAEAVAVHKIEQMREQEGIEGEPDETWKTIPALFGFPVKSETTPLTCRPWMTWTLSAVIALISIIAFTNLDAAINTWGFVPAEALRYGGITLLTSFFLHAGIVHLVGNLYFLLVFGDSVEDYLGRWRYLLLILLSTITGDCIHWAFQSGSTTPCIGASGGISGVIVFFALQFPKARLCFLLRAYWRFRWLKIPAWGALVLWLIMQSFGAFMELSGYSHVASTAHLGGSAAGFLFWWQWRKKKPQPAN
ncbi:MAG TPA: rhomboid family intramembrane serine protease [Verrucomicrobiae bacterium]|nr:rhomboid family intramembrane serine protease [Verrucomicrobiae bacterium]